MRNMYGNRSIIPNNYYFTFDKIYENENAVLNNTSDGVLIGRAVLAKAESTVWLKINGPNYIKVAKLDEEGRFAYYEGFILDSTQNIDKISSKGNTANDDGVYIAEKGKVKGTFPTTLGFESYADGRVFLLEQYSNNITTDNGFTKVTNKEDAIQKQKQGFTLFTKQENGEGQKATYVPAETLSVEGGEYYILTSADIETYQFITDISQEEITDTKHNTHISEKIDHKHKGFIRKCTFHYSQKVENDNKETYRYDVFSGKMKGTGNTKYLADGFVKDDTTWEKWEDMTEQYTGYLGALNGTNFNHVNTKFSDSNKAGTYLTLVDAINQLDKVIGSTNKRFGNDTEHQLGTTNDDGYTASASSLNGDIRKFNIKETTLADAIVKHDADIGPIEEIDGDNLGFSKTENAQLNATEGQAIIHSMTDAIKALDDIIGTLTTVIELEEVGTNALGETTEASDIVNAISILKQYIGTMLKLKNKDELKNDNLVDAILQLKDYIGTMADLKEKSELEKDNLVEAILQLKDYIGTMSELRDEKNQVNTSNLVDAIERLNAVIGDLTTLKQTNGVDNSVAGTIVAAINKLNEYLGDLTGSTPTNQISLKTVADAIKKLDEYIGTIKNGITIQNETMTNLAAIVTKLNSVLGLVQFTGTKNLTTLSTAADAIKKLDEIIGTFSKTITNKNQYDTLTVTGNSIMELLQAICKEINLRAKEQDFDNLRRLINNLGENMDILDINVTNLLNGQTTEGTISLTWGEF